jgi:transposase
MEVTRDMVTLGVDAHKRTHTIVVVDDAGRELGQRTVAANTDGHLAALRWAGQWPERRWALEDCAHLTRRLKVDLLVAGEGVVRVPPKMMAGVRRSARERGKSDPIDARAVAQAALRQPDLPVARLDGRERELRLLVDHREDLVGERTRIMSRLRWHLHELEPGNEPAPRSLDRRVVLDALVSRLADDGRPVARLARSLVERLRLLTTEINELEREISRTVASVAPSLLALTGCGPLTAAKLVGEVAGIDRFRSRGAFAMHNGTAPVPVWSGNTERFRLNRGGNRQINVALHRIAITQMQRPGPAQDYIARRRQAGSTKSEAIRSLRRFISDEVYRRMQLDSAQTAARPALPLAAAA